MLEIVCPHCGEKIIPNDYFCDHCGENLKHETTKLKESELVLENHDNIHVTIIKDSENQKPTFRTTSKTKSTLIIVMIFAFLVIIVMILPYIASDLSRTWFIILEIVFAAILLTCGAFLIFTKSS